MIHGAGRILGWKPAASAFLQVSGFLWALGLSQNPTGMVLYGTPPNLLPPYRIKQERYHMGPPPVPYPIRGITNSV